MKKAAKTEGPSNYLQVQGRRNRMVKLPDDHPLKDVTILQNNSKPSHGNLELYSDLMMSSAKGKLQVHDNKDSVKKRKFNKLEAISMTGFKNYDHFGFEQSFKKNFSYHNLASSLSLSCSNIKKETYKQEDYSSPSQREPNHASASGLVCGPKLVVMSCLNCYLHVMVSDANPKCPKCWRGDCLLDMYR